jgi:hypothetical protein
VAKGNECQYHNYNHLDVNKADDVIEYPCHAAIMGSPKFRLFFTGGYEE